MNKVLTISLKPYSSILMFYSCADKKKENLLLTLLHVIFDLSALRGVVYIHSDGHDLGFGLCISEPISRELILCSNTMLALHYSIALHNQVLDNAPVFKSYVAIFQFWNTSLCLKFN